MAVVTADSVLHADELEPGDEIYLWDVGWDMRHHLPNVWNWTKGAERRRAIREPARVSKVIALENDTYVQFENFPDWVIPNEIEIRVRTHDAKESA